MSQLENSHGFSLVEVMVAVGILSIMTLAISTSIIDSRKAISGLEMKLEQVGFETSFRQEIAQNAACLRTFQNVRILPTDLTVDAEIQINPANITFRNAPLSNQTFTNFENLRTQDIVFRVTSIPAANSAAGELSFRQVGKANRSNYMALKPVTINFQITVNATGVITSCPAIAVAANSIPTAVPFSVFGGSGQTNVTFNIPGSFTLCSYSGSVTTADDSNMYDSCIVDQTAPGSWRLLLRKYSGDTLRCYASCINF